MAKTVKYESGDIIIDKVDTSEAEVIEAQYDDKKDFILDKKGYFLIRIKDHQIEVGFCEEVNKVKYLVKGNKPIDIYMTILRKKIITNPEHAAYLGRELQKADTALKQNLRYVQDEELIF